MADDKPLHLFEKDKSWWWQRRTTLEKILLCLFLVVFGVALASVVCSIVLGRQQFNKYHQCLSDTDSPYTNVKLSQNAQLQREIGDYMMEIVDHTNIQGHLRTLTKDYHPAGSDANNKAFDYIVDTWNSYGLDKVEREYYQVLLSYPDYNNPSTIHLMDGTVISNGTSTKLGPQEALDEQHDSAAMIWWNAYSKNGTATGQIVYCGYCTEDDFQLVTSQNIQIANKIVLCRYGYGWRGAKVFYAEQYHASGVIIYSDPADYGPPDTDSSDFVFPDSIYMPPTGAQRGSLNQLDGDPETPLYPSKPYTYRWYNEFELRNKSYLPSVPVMPIGYGDAANIFQAMQSTCQLSFKNFTGGLKNLTYCITSDTTFQMTVNTYTAHKTIQNVIGYIWGKDEPDRQVLVSNHVDAWTYGAQDPNSGTAISLEMSRVFMAAINATGWRPRRTVVFCQWDAEEYGLIGSTEWAEQKLKLLESRAVALINVDVAVKGNQTLSVGSVPLLYRALVNASTLTPNPSVAEINETRSTVYDSWLFYKNNSLVANDNSVPYMKLPSGGSDHKTFLEYVGVPVIDMTYDTAYDPDNYPLYHTMYEIDWTMENLVDVNFTVSKAMVQLWGEVTRNLADSLIIPFNVSDYGSMMIQYVNHLQTTLRSYNDIEDVIVNFDEIMSNLTDTADKFLQATIKMQDFVNKANWGSPTSLSMIEALNSRLISLERVFIDPRGLPERPHIRHVVFASSATNVYSSGVFVGVTDSLSSYYNDGRKDDWKKIVNLQLTAVLYSLESAIELLELPPTLSV